MKKTAKEKAEKKVKKLLEKLLKFTPNSEEKTLETFLKELTAKASAILLLEFTQESNVTIEELEYLIGQGADVNAKGKYGVTPLHNLIYNGEYKAVEFLLSKGANPAMCNSIGRNSLHVAAFKNNLGIVELLLKQGTLTDEDKNKKDDDKNPPLYWAIKNKNYEMVEKLLENGANPNLDSTEGNLFHVAVEFCEEKMGQLLLKFGAEIEPNEHKRLDYFPRNPYKINSEIEEISSKFVKFYFANHVVVKIIKKCYFELFLQLVESKKIDLTKNYFGFGKEKPPLSFLDKKEIPRLLDLLTKKFSGEVVEEVEKSMEPLSETVEPELFGKLLEEDSI